MKQSEETDTAVGLTLAWYSRPPVPKFLHSLISWLDKCSMYVRLVKVRSSSGAVNEYVRVVEAYREQGKVKQRVILDLGRRDKLVSLLPKLETLLSPKKDVVPLPASDVVEDVAWGPILVIESLLRELKFRSILDNLSDPHKENLADRTFCMLVYEVVRRTFDMQFCDWLNSFYLCDRTGRRYICTKEQHVTCTPDFLSESFRSFIEVASHSIHALFETRIKEIDVDMSASHAWNELATIRVVTLPTPENRNHQTLALGTSKARGIAQRCKAHLALPLAPKHTDAIVFW